VTQASLWRKCSRNLVRVGTGLLVSVIGAAAYLTVSTGTAYAWTGPSRIVSAAPLDWCPGNASVCQDSQRVTTLKANTTVTMVCWIDARHEPGFQYPRWFYVQAGSVTGFVKAELVANQNPHSPACTGNSAVEASLWTTGPDQFGQEEPTQADRNLAKELWGITNWTLGGTSNGWAGNCVIFAGLAWYSAGAHIKTGATASVIAREYRLTDNLTPPIGALVFWGGSVGHVAVSIGNGQVVGTQGYSTLEPTAKYKISSVTSEAYPYLGWVAFP
jgi:hypothetical protein